MIFLDKFLLLPFFCAVATNMSSDSTVPARNIGEGKEWKSNNMYRQQKREKDWGGWEVEVHCIEM